jgi:hypothetical protein
MMQWLDGQQPLVPDDGSILACLTPHWAPVFLTPVT